MYIHVHAHIHVCTLVYIHNYTFILRLQYVDILCIVVCAVLGLHPLPSPPANCIHSLLYVQYMYMYMYMYKPSVVVRIHHLDSHGSL